jgi:2-oxoglutarate ferredoxin oxidoreductase subunit beta
MSALVDEDRLEHPPADHDLPRVTRHRTAEIQARLRTPYTLWCAGCTNGIVTRGLVDAIMSVGLDHQKVVIIAGIGCAGRIAQYLEYSSVHTAHGRALAVATGAKLADPSLHVIVAMGDGDCAAIGGNHFIHAARRNIDLTALVFNNSIYGMTGGQTAPTTPEGDVSKTSPYGNPEPAFDICELAHAAGATYVARATPYGYLRMVQLIAGGILHKGFSLVEVMSACPTFYGRQNVGGSAAELLRRQKSQAVPADKFGPGPAERGQYPVGVLHHVERAELTETYAALRQSVEGK